MNAAEFNRRRDRILRDQDRPNAWRKRALQHLVRESGAEEIKADRHVVGYLLPGGQVACTKRRYGLESDAAQALIAINTTAGTHTKPIRYFPCRFCRGWHTTSSIENYSQ